MNTHTLRRHVKPQLCADTSRTLRPAPALPPIQNLVADLCFICFLNPQLRMGEQADHQPRRLRLKARDFLPFTEGDINLGVMYTNGKGVRQDFVRAHMWFTLAAAALNGDSGDTATKNRDRIASKMTAEQIATAQEMARHCQESKLKNCD
jgi:hypothetical protein